MRFIRVAVRGGVILDILDSAVGDHPADACTIRMPATMMAMEMAFILPLLVMARCRCPPVSGRRYLALGRRQRSQHEEQLMVARPPWPQSSNFFVPRVA